LNATPLGRKLGFGDVVEQQQKQTVKPRVCTEFCIRQNNWLRELHLNSVFWRRKRDSLVRKWLIMRNLMILERAGLAQFTPETQFWLV
jgi:hypothetical protein